MRSKQNWPALILEWQQSGLSKVAFCKDKGLSYQSFLWQLRRGEQRSDGEFKRLVVREALPDDRIDYHFADGRCVSFPVSAPRELIRFLIGQ